jgi:hypothetical protein
LALAFVSVGHGPLFSDFQASRDLQLHLSLQALKEGCHLPETAQDLLEGLQAFGVAVVKTVDEEREPGVEWAAWWNGLETVTDRAFDLELDIV